MPTIRTMSRASATEPMPSHVVSTRKPINPRNADSMKTSPWAKLTMPMMPKTIV